MFLVVVLGGWFVTLEFTCCMVGLNCVICFDVYPSWWVEVGCCRFRLVWIGIVLGWCFIVCNLVVFAYYCLDYLLIGCLV